MSFRSNVDARRRFFFYLDSLGSWFVIAVVLGYTEVTSAPVWGWRNLAFFHLLFAVVDARAIASDVAAVFLSILLGSVRSARALFFGAASVSFVIDEVCGCLVTVELMTHDHCSELLEVGHRLEGGSDISRIVFGRAVHHLDDVGQLAFVSPWVV